MKTINRQEVALYRVRLKRIVRSAMGWVDNDLSTETLEASVKEIGGRCPNVVARSLDAVFESAAQAWIFGNNSGNSDTLRDYSDTCDRYRASAVAVLELFGIETDFPGLYPSFTVKGYAHHSTLSALIAARD